LISPNGLAGGSQRSEWSMVDGLDDAEEGRRLEKTTENDHKDSRFFYSNFENI